MVTYTELGGGHPQQHVQNKQEETQQSFGNELTGSFVPPLSTTRQISHRGNTLLVSNHALPLTASHPSPRSDKITRSSRHISDKKMSSMKATYDQSSTKKDSQRRSTAPFSVMDIDTMGNNGDDNDFDFDFSASPQKTTPLTSQHHDATPSSKKHVPIVSIEKPPLNQQNQGHHPSSYPGNSHDQCHLSSYTSFPSPYVASHHKSPHEYGILEPPESTTTYSPFTPYGKSQPRSLYTNEWGSNENKDWVPPTTEKRDGKVDSKPSNTTVIPSAHIRSPPPKKRRYKPYEDSVDAEDFGSSIFRSPTSRNSNLLNQELSKSPLRSPGFSNLMGASSFELVQTPGREYGETDFAHPFEDATPLPMTDELVGSSPLRFLSSTPDTYYRPRDNSNLDSSKQGHIVDEYGREDLVLARPHSPPPSPMSYNSSGRLFPVAPPPRSTSVGSAMQRHMLPPPQANNAIVSTGTSMLRPTYLSQPNTWYGGNENKGGFHLEIGTVDGMKQTETRKGMEGINTALKNTNRPSTNEMFSRTHSIGLDPRSDLKTPVKLGPRSVSTPSTLGRSVGFGYPNHLTPYNSARMYPEAGGFSPPVIDIGKENQTPKSNKQRNACNCKKSRCLKLYCECFAALIYCDNCNCVSCNNLEEFEAVRSKAIKDTKAKNQLAFQDKLTSPAQGHNTGCKCKKSRCLKLYCECFDHEVHCSSRCKCNQCSNFPGSQDLIDILRKNKSRRADEEARLAHDLWKPMTNPSMAPNMVNYSVMHPPSNHFVHRPMHMNQMTSPVGVMHPSTPGHFMPPRMMNPPHGYSPMNNYQGAPVYRGHGVMFRSPFPRHPIVKEKPIVSMRPRPRSTTVIRKFNPHSNKNKNDKNMEETSKYYFGKMNPAQTETTALTILSYLDDIYNVSLVSRDWSQLLYCDQLIKLDKEM